MKPEKFETINPKEKTTPPTTEGEFSLFQEGDGEEWKEGDARNEIGVADKKTKTAVIEQEVSPKETEKCRYCGLVSHGVDCPTLVVGYHGERKAALEAWQSGYSDAQSPTIKEPRRARNKYYMMGWEKLGREQSENLPEKLDKEKFEKERATIMAQIKTQLSSIVSDQIKEQKIAELRDILKETPKRLLNAKLQEFLDGLKRYTSL